MAPSRPFSDELARQEPGASRRPARRTPSRSRLGNASIDSTDCIAYLGRMATMTIRNLPDEVHARLRMRAAKAGRSMEAEVRAILIETCSETEARTTARQLQSFVQRMYGGSVPSGVVEDLVRRRRKEAARE